MPSTWPWQLPRDGTSLLPTNDWLARSAFTFRFVGWARWCDGAARRVWFHARIGRYGFNGRRFLGAFYSNRDPLRPRKTSPFPRFADGPPHGQTRPAYQRLR